MVKEISNEVLTKIFSQLATQKLLAIREVCKRWSSICRRRGLALKAESKFLWKLKLKKSENVPWSAVTIHTSDSMMDDQYKTRVFNFLRYCGTYITKLTLYNTTMLMDILEHVPFIQELSIHFYEHRAEVQDFSRIATLSLKCLRRLKLVAYPGQTNFLESVVSLPDIKLQVLDIQPEAKNLTNALRLLVNLPFVELNISYSKTTMEAFEVLSSEQFALRKLILKIESAPTGIEPGIYTSNAERFLQNCVDLEYLDFTCMAQHPGFKLPALRKLKSFSNHLVYRGDWKFTKRYSAPRQHTFLEALGCNHFQNLLKISLTGCFEGCYTKGIFKNCNFPSVQDLELDWLHFNEEWGPIFPNLKKMKATVDHGISDILKMQQLEHVYVEVSGTKDTAILQPWAGSDIGDMKRLTTFELAYENRRFLTDFCVRPLLEIHPLECVVFRNVQMSKYSKEELRARHQFVVMD